MLEWFALPSPVDHILSDLSTMTQPSWLSVTELDAAVILGSDWLVSVMMVLVCLPFDALSQHLPSYLVSLTSGVGYLFTAAPAKRTQPLLLTLDEGYLLTAAPPDLEHEVAPLGSPAL